MTVEELRQKINTFSDDNGIGVPVPQMMEVDAETYINVCQFIFKTKSVWLGQYNTVIVHLGMSNGVMFKGVELILKEKA